MFNAFQLFRTRWHIIRVPLVLLYSNSRGIPPRDHYGPRGVAYDRSDPRAHGDKLAQGVD